MSTLTPVQTTPSTVVAPVAVTPTVLPTSSALLFFLIFIIIILGLIIWIVFMYETLSDQSLTNNQSPLCLGNTSPSYPTVTCPTGTQLLNVQLDPNTNPDTANYETLNYCSINAPPTSFVQSLEVCAGIIDPSQANVGNNVIPPMTASGVTEFANFYNNNYIQTCGYSWKNPPPIDLTQPPQADPVLIALIGCARQLGVSSDPNVSALASICGSSCNFSPGNFVPITPISS